MQIIFTTPAKRRLKKIYAYYEKASSKRIAESIANDIVTATEMLLYGKIIKNKGDLSWVLSTQNV